jgi:hypothetical protein
MAVGATSVTLQSATDDDNIALPAGHYFFAIDGDNAQKEHISCDLSGTSLTNIKSLSRQGVETSGCVRTHRVGSSVTLTDFAHIKYINDLIAGTTQLNSAVPLAYDGTADMTGNDNKLATVAYVKGIAIAGSPDATTTTKGISKMSVAPVSPTSPIAVGDNDGRVPTQNENDALVGTSGTPVSSSNKLVDNADTTGTGSIVRASVTTGLVRFGGTGSDGALAISSGTTTVDCAGAAVLVKNYSSVSITGTAKLAFSNANANGTVVILKSQGAVTLTSSQTPMIDCSAMGGAGGVAGATGASAGATAADTNAFTLFVSKGGLGGTTSGVAAAAPAKPTAIAPVSFITATFKELIKYGLQLWVGGGGGGGGAQNASNNSTQGTGGRGGGCLVIECAGALNFTTASGISVAGGAATAPTNTTFGGAGAGGAAGMCLVLYNTLTAASGTITVTGGAGAANGTNVGASSGSSGATPYTVGLIGIVGPGTSPVGATGESLIAANTLFA